MFELTGKEKSPLEALSRVRFGGKTYLETSPKTATTTATQILKNNPNRVFVLLINTGANDVLIGIGTNNFSTFGILLAANYGTFSMQWEEDGELVGYDIWGSAVANTSLIRRIEVIRE